MEPLHATDGSNGVPLLPWSGGRRVPAAPRPRGRVTELDEMFGGIVETAFRLHRASTVQKHFSHLTGGPRQPSSLPTTRWESRAWVNSCTVHPTVVAGLLPAPGCGREMPSARWSLNGFQQVQRSRDSRTAFSGLSAPMWISEIYEGKGRWHAGRARCVGWRALLCNRHRLPRRRRRAPGYSQIAETRLLEAVVPSRDSSSRGENARCLSFQP